MMKFLSLGFVLAAIAFGSGCMSFSGRRRLPPQRRWCSAHSTLTVLTSTRLSNLSLVSRSCHS
jgi:hypothetical protein